jgi:hypothetical protein
MGVDLASNLSNRGLPLGIKKADAGADNLTIFMCRLSENSESLNLLEPQGPI